MRVNAIEEYQNLPCRCDFYESLGSAPGSKILPTMVTIKLNAGRKGSKLRASDILGALTGEAGLAGSDVGKIDILDNSSYVAVKRCVLYRVMDYFTTGKLKGRTIRARKI